ncbi:sporulation protein, partial [Bacillus licheniformis]|nr:sporulation protein [Bacillus licheniformis]
EEGGTGASVEYISPSDNRGAGSWVGNQVSDYPDGTKILFKIK